eukprot:2466021-Prymnesium_polylepis.1
MERRRRSGRTPRCSASRTRRHRRLHPHPRPHPASGTRGRQPSACGRGSAQAAVPSRCSSTCDSSRAAA